MKNIWEILGIDPTKDIKLIKKAFSERSKAVHPEEHPIEFMELRRAYQAACAYTVAEKEEFFISEIEDPLSKELIIEKEERINIFTTLKLKVQEEKFLEKEKNIKENIFIGVEEVLVQMQMDIESLIIEIKKIVIDSPRSNQKFIKVFNSERYLRFREKEEFVEILTDILVSRSYKAKFSKTLMKELLELKVKFETYICIKNNILYIESVQNRLPKNKGIPSYRYFYIGPIVVMLALYPFVGPIILYFMLAFYMPIGLVVFVLNFLVKD